MELTRDELKRLIEEEATMDNRGRFVMDELTMALLNVKPHSGDK